MHLDDYRLLLVDDERSILELLTIMLNKEGFTSITTAVSAEQAIAACQLRPPHLIVLDVMLVDMDGFELARQLRQRTTAPILFLSARSTDADKLKGFAAGGDDYITKPFNPLEVLARIVAQFKRAQLSSVAPLVEFYDFGRFQVHGPSAELIVEGLPIVCPAKEFQLLLFLCKHQNRVFSAEQLYERVWGESSVGDVNTVTVHVRRLREKIEVDSSRPEYLVTVRGLGYKLLTSAGGSN